MHVLVVGVLLSLCGAVALLGAVVAAVSGDGAVAAVLFAVLVGVLAAFYVVAAIQEQTRDMRERAAQRRKSP